MRVNAPMLNIETRDPCIIIEVIQGLYQDLQVHRIQHVHAEADFVADTLAIIIIKFLYY